MTNTDALTHTRALNDFRCRKRLCHQLNLLTTHRSTVTVEYIHLECNTRGLAGRRFPHKFAVSYHRQQCGWVVRVSGDELPNLFRHLTLWVQISPRCVLSFIIPELRNKPQIFGWSIRTLGRRYQSVRSDSLRSDFKSRYTHLPGLIPLPDSWVFARARCRSWQRHKHQAASIRFRLLVWQQLSPSQYLGSLVKKQGQPFYSPPLPSVSDAS